MTMPNEALRTILPIAGWPDRRAEAVVFTGGTDPVLPTPFRIGAAGAATLAATGLAATRDLSVSAADPAVWDLTMQVNLRGALVLAMGVVEIRPNSGVFDYASKFEFADAFGQIALPQVLGDH